MVCFLCLFAALFLVKCHSHCTQFLPSLQTWLCWCPSGGFPDEPDQALTTQVHFVLFQPSPCHFQVLHWHFHTDLYSSNHQTSFRGLTFKDFFLARGRKPLRLFLVKIDFKERRLGCLNDLEAGKKGQPGSQEALGLWTQYLSVYPSLTGRAASAFYTLPVSSILCSMFATLFMAALSPWTFCLYAALAFGSRHDFHSILPVCLSTPSRATVTSPHYLNC